MQSNLMCVVSANNSKAKESPATLTNRKYSFILGSIFTLEMSLDVKFAVCDVQDNIGAKYLATQTHESNLEAPLFMQINKKSKCLHMCYSIAVCNISKRSTHVSVFLQSLCTIEYSQSFY